MSNKLRFGFFLLYFVVKPRLLLAQQQQLISRELAPPAFHTGSVFHTVDDEDYKNLNLGQFDGMSAALYLAFGGWESPNATINTATWASVVDTIKSDINRVVHGHILVYPNVNLGLDWWVQQPNSLVQSRMYKWIDTLVSVRKGKIWIWDVVNEVMGDDGDDMDQDGVRTTFWHVRPIKEYEAMGQSFISKAFQRAHSKDPNALLLLVDYACEEDDPSNDNEKSDRFFRFVKKLKSQKVPIHGVGMQFHLSAIPGREPNYTRIVVNFQRYRNAGIPIFITELDVKSYETTDPSSVSYPDLLESSARQALVYGRVTKICLNDPICKCLLMWDDAEYNSHNPNKKYSWQHPQADNPNLPPTYYYPSPFWDINPNDFIPKPSWYAMQSALANFTGVYRVTSLWKPATSYLTRSGTTTPEYSVRVATLNTKSNSWTSMKWRFERVSVGVYRIACKWGYTSGYLSRAGLQDPNSLEYHPSDQLNVDSLHLDWGSQQWRLEYVYDNLYRIVNLWGPSNGTLTRSGQIDQNGNIVPAGQVNLAPTNETWSSQLWRLERVWSAGDTKTAVDFFWL